MTYEAKLQRAIIVIGVVLAVGLIFVPYWGGALAMLVVILTTLGIIAINRHVALAFSRTLRATGAELGLHCAERDDDPRYREFAFAATKTFETSTRTWKVDGRFPCLIGRLNGFLVTVRVPFGFQYDRSARETTRIAVHHRNGFEGFVVERRSGLKEEPQHVLRTDDQGFDTEYAVTGRHAGEMQAVLTADARAAIERLPDTGLGGIRVTPYGIFYHAPGKLVAGEAIRLILEVLCVMAAGIPERDPLHHGSR